MTKKALAMLGLETGEGGAHGVLKVGKGAGGGVSQVGLEFGEGHFDRIEIRAVGRKIAHARSAGGDQGLDAGDFVGGEIVEDDDVALFEFGTQHGSQIRGEDFRVDRAFDQKRSRDFLRPQRGDEGGALPVAVGNRRETTAAPGAASVTPRHLGVEAGLVDEDQPRTIQRGLRLAPTLPRGFDVGPLLLGGVDRFFYSSGPGGRAGARVR